MKVFIPISHALYTKSSKYVLEYLKHSKHDVHVLTSEVEKGFENLVHKIPVGGSFRSKEYQFFLIATVLSKLHDHDISMAQATRFFSPDVCYMQFVYRKFAEMMSLKSGFNKIVLRVEKRNVKKAKKVVVMSKKLASEIIEYYKVPREKIEVVYSGVDSSLFKPNPKLGKEVRKVLRIGDEPVVLFVGNPFSRKGLSDLISAVPKGSILLVAGKSLPEDPIEKYIAKARRLGLRLIYLGLVKDVQRYYAAADVFVLPSIYEPFGLVVLEAMASELPVVVTKAVGASEIVDGGGIVVKDKKDLSGAIISAIDEKKKIGKKARRIASKYTWSSFSERMDSVLESVAKS
ncbi:MAG: glycosyltransferase family 4 protein [Candidatus Micrarchaeota archaeon]|nr:glycosyltransferase family 4 protein [Candidatus Micrarchaeota archaeon]